MSIAKMEKLAVIGLSNTKDKLIADLADLGVVEITERFIPGADEIKDPDAPEALESQASEIKKPQEVFDKVDGDPDFVSTIEGEMSRTDTALDTLKRYSKEKEPLFATKKVINGERLKDLLNRRAEIEGYISSILRLNYRLHMTDEKINKMSSDLASLKPWIVYDVPLDISETKFTNIELGVVPSTVNLDNIKEKFSELELPSDISVVNSDRELIYLAVVMMKEGTDNVLGILKQYGFTQLPFQGFEGRVSDNIEKITKQIDEQKDVRRELEDEVAGYGKMQQDIEFLSDYLTIERDRERIKSKMRVTKRTFNFEGWVPSHLKDGVERILDRYGCHYEYREPLEGEEVPVMIENSAAVTPFEAVTQMYSMPDYKGFDPTKWFAIFYAMFFGIMLSDAGYGLVITIATFVALKKFELEGMTKKMVKMFMYCGIATVFWGAMFGGWFGDLID